MVGEAKVVGVAEVAEVGMVERVRVVEMEEAREEGVVVGVVVEEGVRGVVRVGVGVVVGGGRAEVVEEMMERVGLGGRLRDGPVSGLRRA